MDRRRLLGGAVTAISTSLVGCLGNGQVTSADDNERSDQGNGADATNAEHTCDTTDAGAPIDIDGYPGIDAPPHDIERPEEGRMADREYLGHCMATAPTLPFEVLRAAGSTEVNRDWDGAYWVGLLTSEDEREEVLDELFADTDFDEYVLVAVHSRGSHGNEHRWKRVEDVEEGIHLHGYYRLTDTLDDRIIESIIKVDRPSGDVDIARVSLTRREDERYHIDSDVSPTTPAEMRG